MGDFEIFPYEGYMFNDELTEAERTNLDLFVSSFRETFFKRWGNPKQKKGIWVLRYKWTILRNDSNSNDINDRIKILYLIIKLHLSFDFFNPSFHFIDLKSFDFFYKRLDNEYGWRFWVWWKCIDLHSTIPENISWLEYIKIFPIENSHFDIWPMLRFVSNGDEFFWIDSSIDDLTEIFSKIYIDKDYYPKFLAIANIYFWLERQIDVFFYLMIIPSILEILFWFSEETPRKKKESIWKWKELDQYLLEVNEMISVNTYKDIYEELWVIARSIHIIYDLRNKLVHEWIKDHTKITVSYKWYNLRLYDVFQIIIKYIILDDLVKNNVVDSQKFTTMDEAIWNLYRKTKSDYEISLNNH